MKPKTDYDNRQLGRRADAYALKYTDPDQKYITYTAYLAGANDESIGESPQQGMKTAEEILTDNLHGGLLNHGIRTRVIDAMESYASQFNAKEDELRGLLTDAVSHWESLSSVVNQEVYWFIKAKSLLSTKEDEVKWDATDKEMTDFSMAHAYQVMEDDWDNLVDVAAGTQPKQDNRDEEMISFIMWLTSVYYSDLKHIPAESLINAFRQSKTKLKS